VCQQVSAESAIGRTSEAECSRTGVFIDVDQYLGVLVRVGFPGAAAGKFQQNDTVAA